LLSIFSAITADAYINLGIFGTVGSGVATVAGQAAAVTASAIGGAIQAFAAITIIFAVLEYTKTSLSNADMLSSLPEIPEARMKIAPFWPIFGIALSVSITALFIAFPEVARVRFEFEWIAIFDATVIRGLWLPILLWAILEIVSEITKLVEGRYTMRLAGVALITGILQLVFAVAVLGRNTIFNPEFISRISDTVEVGDVVESLIARPNLVLLVIAVVIILFETLEVVVKAFQARNA